MAFLGFPTDTVPFLVELTCNNDKDWFDQNRKRYESVYLQAAKDFVEAIEAKLQAISGTVHAVPAVNKSIFRVNRDTRFSKDKTPYKNHIDLMFWDGEGRSRDCAAFFLRLTPDRFHIGAGKHGDVGIVDFSAEKFAALAPLLFWVRDHVVEPTKT